MQAKCKKIVKKLGHFTRKPYLCKPIIIREPLKRLKICVLIAFSIGLGERLVNRRNEKRAGESSGKETLVVNKKQV